MIVLFTDYGTHDLYVGQIRAVLAQYAPDVPVIDLLHEVPNFNITSGAHLLAALVVQFPQESVFLSVVDPGVGGARKPVVVRADERWYVGPDNGLLSVLAARAGDSKAWQINWRPKELSHCFHGRDLFAPIAGMISNGGLPKDALSESNDLEVQISTEDLAEIIYIDHYGNAVTGMRASTLPHETKIKLGTHLVGYARVFSDLPAGRVFWHRNSLGLIEIAVNCGSAAQQLGITVGQPFVFDSP
ncbi:MAG: SAM hydrolase/SAM-dependent halogenase family protein [Burkholderiales bacterium]